MLTYNLSMITPLPLHRLWQELEVEAQILRYPVPQLSSLVVGHYTLVLTTHMTRVRLI